MKITKEQAEKAVQAFNDPEYYEQFTAKLSAEELKAFLHFAVRSIIVGLMQLNADEMQEFYRLMGEK